MMVDSTVVRYILYYSAAYTSRTQEIRSFRRCTFNDVTHTPIAPTQMPQIIYEIQGGFPLQPLRSFPVLFTSGKKKDINVATMRQQSSTNQMLNTHDDPSYEGLYQTLQPAHMIHHTSSLSDTTCRRALGHAKVSIHIDDGPSRRPYLCRVVPGVQETSTLQLVSFCLTCHLEILSFACRDPSTWCSGPRETPYACSMVNNSYNTKRRQESNSTTIPGCTHNNMRNKSRAAEPLLFCDKMKASTDLINDY